MYSKFIKEDLNIMSKINRNVDVLFTVSSLHKKLW